MNLKKAKVHIFFSFHRSYDNHRQLRTNMRLQKLVIKSYQISFFSFLIVCTSKAFIVNYTWEEKNIKWDKSTECIVATGHYCFLLSIWSLLKQIAHFVSCNNDVVPMYCKRKVKNLCFLKCNPQSWFWQCQIKKIWI